jgi:uncharacterized protein YciI
MPTWSQYKQTASSRGALAFELYVVLSTLSKTPEDARAVLPQHLEYQGKMEAAGKLFLAGPMSDPSGEQMSGDGLIIYRANSIEEAREIAENDPMHKAGARTFTLRRWLVNEGSISITAGLSGQNIRLA